MKITQEEIVNRQTVLHIELENEDLEKYLDQGYRRVAQQTIVPGFRKGKAPRRIVERYLGREALLGEVIDSMLPEVTDRAIAEQELEASGLPRIELVGMEPMALDATVPLDPEIEVGAYKDIRIAEEPVEVTEEDIERHLEQLRHSMASWDPVERAVEMGDLVTMEAVGTVDGRTVLNEKDAVFFLDEDGARPFPGFSQHLVGMVKEDSKDFAMPIPEDFSDESIAGKEAEISVTVSEIKRRVLPDLDDEFAKGVGDGHENLAELREKVKTELRTEAQAKAAREHREAVVTALTDSMTIELPPILVDHEIAHMEDDRAAMLSRVNVRMDDYLQSIGKTAEEMRNELRDEAVNRLKRSFFLAKVGELEGVEVSDEEVEERVKALLGASSQQSGEREVSDEARSSVRRMKLLEKTVDLLAAIAKGETENESMREERQVDLEQEGDENDK